MSDIEPTRLLLFRYGSRTRLHPIWGPQNQHIIYASTPPEQDSIEFRFPRLMYEEQYAMLATDGFKNFWGGLKVRPEWQGLADADGKEVVVEGYKDDKYIKVSGKLSLHTKIRGVERFDILTIKSKESHYTFNINQIDDVIGPNCADNPTEQTYISLKQI